MPQKPRERPVDAIWEDLRQNEQDLFEREAFRNVGMLAASFVLGCAAAWAIFVLDWWTIVWFGGVWAVHEATEFIVRRRWPE